MKGKSDRWKALCRRDRCKSREQGKAGMACGGLKTRGFDRRLRLWGGAQAKCVAGTGKIRFCSRVCGLRVCKGGWRSGRGTDLA